MPVTGAGPTVSGNPRISGAPCRERGQAQVCISRPGSCSHRREGGGSSVLPPLCVAAPSPTRTVSPSWRRGGVRRGGGSKPRPCYLVPSPEPWGETQGTPGAVLSGQSSQNGHAGEQIRCTEGGTQRACHRLPARSQQPWGALSEGDRGPRQPARLLSRGARASSVRGLCPRLN